MGRILVIRGGAIGDFILTLPAIRLLREAFPEAHLEILGYRHIIALAEGRFYAQASRSIEYAALSRFFIPNAELDPELTEYFGSFHQVISYLFDPDRFFENNLRRSGVKNLITGSPKIGDNAHASHQLAEPLQALALFLEAPSAQLFPTPVDEAEAASLLDDSSAPLIALHPGSGGERKCWPVEKWAAVVKALHQDFPEVRFVLVGGEADENRLSTLEDSLAGVPYRVLKNLPLPILAAVFKRCALFLGHDSGISHIAAAVGAPCVLLFGPTDPDVWAPKNPRVQVVGAPDGLLVYLPVERVLTAAAEVLKAAG